MPSSADLLNVIRNANGRVPLRELCRLYAGVLRRGLASRMEFRAHLLEVALLVVCWAGPIPRVDVYMKH